MARSIRSFLALVFILAGISFLAGGETSLALFQQIGLGQWFRYAVGLFVLSGGMLLFIPSRAVIGSAMATTITLGALLFQAFIALGSPLLTVILAFLAGGSLVHAELEGFVATRR